MYEKSQMENLWFVRFLKAESMKQLAPEQHRPSDSGDSIGDDQVRLGEGKLGRLKWSGRLASDWEILVYKPAVSWEACIFKPGVRHEHIKGFSLSDVRTRAERRVEALQAIDPRTAQRADESPNRTIDLVGKPTKRKNTKHL
jgi:hypothetical protein